MKQFIKFTFASMLGFLLSIAFLLILFIGIIAGIASQKDSETISIKDNSILHLTLNNNIQDVANDNPFENFDFINLSNNSATRLNEVIKAIETAKTDKNIKAIFLELSSFNSGFASLEEIHNALLDFKKSGKKIISYSESYSHKTYYLASTANQIYLNPVGDLEFKGLSASAFFFKDALEKLGIEPQILRHGKFKSAVEPFILDKMSTENKKQTETYLQSIWKHYIQEIATSREITSTTLDSFANNLTIRNANLALKHKMVDKLLYKDQVLEELGKITNTKDISEIRLIGFNQYRKSSEMKKSSGVRDQIAIIYASGEIVSGNDNNKVASENISKTIREARLNKHVKAIVLRVNSPGGSALASDVIWREVILAKKAKPVIVSMGDVAASGGYYISCAANKIFAEPNTITGSIGVFGLMFNAQKLMNEKLGITIDNVNTNKYSDIGNFHRPFKPEERAIMQQSVEEVYSTFINKVADGRKMTPAQVDSIGQGRIWTGTDAKKIGLVDEIGGLNQAIKEAAKLAKIKSYRTINYPEAKEPIELLIEMFNGDMQSYFAKIFLGEKFNYIQAVEYTGNIEGVQAKMPFAIDIQ